MPALTPDAWAHIRYDYEHTDRPVADICADHGISTGTLRDRMRRWHWRRRRAPIPRAGPPACLVVGGASAPPERAVIVVEPSAATLSDNERADDGRAGDTSGPAPGLAPGFAPVSAPALQEAFTSLLPAIQRELARLAQGQAHPDDAAKYARALQALTRTLRELSGLLTRPPR